MAGDKIIPGSIDYSGDYYTSTIQMMKQ